MLVPLTQLELTAQRERLDDVLATLQRLRVAQPVPVKPAAPGGRVAPEPMSNGSDRLLDKGSDGGAALDRRPVGEAAELAARLEAIRGLLPEPTTPPPDGEPLSLAEIARLLDELEPQVRVATDRIERLRADADTLPSYVRLLGALQPLVPELSKLDDRALADLGLASIALVIEDPHGSVLRSLRATLADLLGPAHLFVVSERNDADRVSCLLVLRRRRLNEVRILLGAELISQVGVPEAFAGRSLRGTVTSMRERLAVLPDLQRQAAEQLQTILIPHADTIVRAARDLAAGAERSVAARHAVHTDRTFSLAFWLPADRVQEVSDRLEHALDSRVVLRQVPFDPADAPVLLRNRLRWHPFEQLVGLLSWPAPRTLDPTGLMAVVLPLFFGMMVGDVGYGLGLLVLAWLLRRRATNTLMTEAGYVLKVSALWAVGFGLLYGEFLGSVGHQLGMPALWFYRGGPQSLPTLLLFSVAVGLAHVVLALLIGMWTSSRLHNRSQVAERLGNLLVLIGLFGLAAVAVAAQPRGLVTPAVALVIVGLVLASVSQGALGLLLGPLGVLGVIGNVLSYLRIAAVGLASFYLADVANELAGQGPLLLGILVAAFFHALNLALAAFSPMVQALRLHYVEFFGQFHEGNGRLFTPLGAVSAGSPGARDHHSRDQLLSTGTN